MMVKRKMMALFLGGGAAVVLGLTSAAWACTSAASLTPVTTSIGAPGSTAKVVGTNFAETVEVRWGTNEGPLLATSAGPSLSVDVTIPKDAQPGVSYLVALSRNPDGTVAGKASLPFEVTGGEPTKSVWLDPKPATRDSSSGEALGVVLLAMGAVGLAGGSLIVASARRRARAGDTGR